MKDEKIKKKYCEPPRSKMILILMEKFQALKTNFHNIEITFKLIFWLWKIKKLDFNHLCEQLQNIKKSEYWFQNMPLLILYIVYTTTAVQFTLELSQNRGECFTPYANIPQFKEGRKHSLQLAILMTLSNSYMVLFIFVMASESNYLYEQCFLHLFWYSFILFS